MFDGGWTGFEEHEDPTTTTFDLTLETYDRGLTEFDLTAPRGISWLDHTVFDPFSTTFDSELTDFDPTIARDQPRLEPSQLDHGTTVFDFNTTLLDQVQALGRSRTSVRRWFKLADVAVSPANYLPNR
jgi:hypothetical protein